MTKSTPYPLALLCLTLLFTGCDPQTVQQIDIQMSDGVSLHTEITGPDGFPDEGPYPVILIRTPYSTQSAENDVAFWTSGCRSSLNACFCQFFLSFQIGIGDKGFTAGQSHTYHQSSSILTCDRSRQSQRQQAKTEGAKPRGATS